jgi:hypothetical protein
MPVLLLLIVLPVRHLIVIKLLKQAAAPDNVNLHLHLHNVIEHY